MSTSPFTSFAMFGAMRSGSNLLEKYLGQYRGLFCHGELFNTHFIGAPGRQEYLGVTLETRQKTPLLLLEAMRAATPDKLPGYRIFQAHDHRVIAHALKDVHCAKVVLTRDPLESFVSLKIAAKTGQWMISDAAHRKAAQVSLDLEEYGQYLAERETYYGEISEALKQSGQPFFEIDYSVLDQVGSLNRLAAFLGLDEVKEVLDQPIKKQNPGPLADKILNYGEVAAALGLPDAPALMRRPEKPAKAVGTDLSRLYFGHKIPIAFAPVPSGPDTAARDWLSFQEGRPPETGYTPGQLEAWRLRHGTPLVFSVVGHPLQRAYEAFMAKIFATTPGSYTEIRQQLESRFGLYLPGGKLDGQTPQVVLQAGGYGVEDHRTAFKQFLVFVAGNLAGKTDIRQDGKWQLQSEIIRRYRILFPDLMIFKEEDLAFGLRYLENRLDTPPFRGGQTSPHPVFSLPLAEIYDDETEALARAAYGPDYAELGYSDLV